LICIDNDVLDTDLAVRIRQAHPADKIRIVASKKEVEEYVKETGIEKTGVKSCLFVTRQKGRFLKRCPGAPGVECCNLFVLNHIVGCPYDCTYCFLQGWQNESFITIYANLDDLEREVEQLLVMNKGKVIRICTGELADSLALDPYSDAAIRLIKFFSNQEDCLLELKTKSVGVSRLLDLDHKGKTVLSWSMNIDESALLDEKGTPSPMQRLKTAQKAAEAGYPLAFHFDPMVRIDNWKEAYTDRVDDIFNVISPNSVKWMSLGGFRYNPQMKNMIKSRFPDTRLFLEEFSPGPGAKYRYLAKNRIEIYREMVQAIRKWGSEIPVYLCMESEYVWRKVFGYLPEESDLLETVFGKRRFIDDDPV